MNIPFSRDTIHAGAFAGDGNSAMQAVTVVNPALCIRMIPRLQRAREATWGWLRHGR
jgi:hypothetical protein